MKHITIIVPESRGNLSTVTCIAAAFEIFETANQWWKNKGRKEPFNIQSAGSAKKLEVYERMFTVRPQTNISSINVTDLIVIPPVPFNDHSLFKANRHLLEWITRQYKKGAAVATMCSGAFFLASSGLLEGRTCSTHFAHADKFRALFPGVKVRADQLITDEKGIYTNGGAYSFLNLLVYLVEKFCDRETAIYCAKMCQIEMDRNTQSIFTIFTGQKLHGDDLVRKAQEFLENNADEKISIESLSAQFAIGRRNFDRRFIKATGNTPMEYAQRVKIESAKKTFETTRKTVNEVMYEVGYADVKAFREFFRKFTGMSPIEYRARYNKEATINGNLKWP